MVFVLGFTGKKTSTSAGDIQWKIDYVVAGARNISVANGSQIEPVQRTTGDTITAATVRSVETTPAGGTNENEIILSDFSDIDINDYYEGDVLFLRLYREYNDPDDTYTDDALMVGFEMSGIFWTIGERIK